MPRLNIEPLDDMPVQDGVPNFSGGQYSFGPPDQIPQSASQYLTNVDIRDGTATTRRGTESLGRPDSDSQIQGLFWFDQPTRERLVAAVGGELWEYDGATWAQIAGYASGSSTAQIQMCQLVDKLYIADTAGHLFEWDGTTLTDLGATTGTPGDPPDTISFVVTAGGRVWAAGIAADPDTLWASYLLDATSWNSTFGNIRIGSGDGDPITGLIGWDDEKVVIFKRNSIYLLTVSPAVLTYADAAHSLSEATITKLSDTIGCVSNRSIARVGNDVWFLSDDGVFSLGRVMATNEREIRQASSIPVQDVIDRVNWQYADKAAGFFWDTRYFLSLPLDDETSPSSTLVFSTKKGAWAGLWTGWGPLCWTLSRPGGATRLDFGRDDGYVWRWLDYVRDENAVAETYQDAGADVATAIVSRAMIFSDARAPKSPLSFEVEFFESEAAATVGVRLDEGSPHELEADFMTAVGVLYLPFTLPATLPSQGIKRRAFGAQHLTQSRSFQCEVTSESGKLSTRAIIGLAFGDSPQLTEP